MTTRSSCPRASRVRLGAALLVALSALFTVSHLRAQSDVLWRYSSKEAISRTILDAKGHLLVITESGLTALDPDSGSRVWRHGTGGIPWVLRHISEDRLLVGSGRTLAVLDLASGDTVWRRTDLPDLDKTWVDTDRQDSSAILQTRNGFAVLDLTSGRTAWDSTALPEGAVVREFFRLRSLDLLMLILQTPASPVTMVGVDIESGVVRWSDTAMFRAGVKFKRVRGVEYAVVHPPVILDDSTLVLYFSTEGPIRLDPRTGEVLWRSKALADAEVPTTRDGYPPSRLLDSLLVVPSDKRLVALDVATGQERWRTSGEFPEKPGWLLTGARALVTGNFGTGKPYITVIDSDGVRRRPTEWRLKAGAHGLLLNDTVYVANDDQLFALPLDTGVERKLAPIEFKGDEKPLDIDSLSDGGLLLMGRQNIVRINLDGTVVYRRYYPAPEASFWEEFSAMAGGMNAPSHAWSAKAQQYFYIFTTRADTAGKKGFSLVALDRRDGQELGRMWFDERNPTWLLDPVNGTVYEVEDKKEVMARRFVGLREQGGE
jgi:outer membrane protein assembly factor BamB